MQAPVEPTVILPFLAAICLIELTPGPNMLYLAALSAAEGRSAGLKAVLGITLGLACYMLASVFGVTQLVAAAPLVYGALRWCGVLYLLYLAWEAWRGARDASPGHSGDGGQAPFWRGLIANLLNPKAAVFYVTLLPGFIAPDHASFWVQAMILGCLHLLVSVAVHSAIVLSASNAALLIARAEEALIVRRALAIGIGLIAIWLIWETR